MWRALSPHEYPLLLKLDKKLYPINSPVTEEQLEVWFSKNPEFGLVLVGDDADGENNDTSAPIFGFFACIPLAKTAWEKLVQGEIEESDVNETDVFDVERDDELYLHIYHMEKDIHVTAETVQPSSRRNYSFVHEALLKVAELIEALRAENAVPPTNRIQLGGISALCVSESGIRTCERSGFREDTFVSDEYMVVDDSGGGNIEVRTFPTQKHAQEICAREGKRIVNRTKLLVTRRRRDMEDDGVSNNIWKTYF